MGFGIFLPALIDGGDAGKWGCLNVSWRCELGGGVLFIVQIYTWKVIKTVALVKLLVALIWCQSLLGVEESESHCRRVLQGQTRLFLLHFFSSSLFIELELLS